MPEASDTDPAASAKERVTVAVRLRGNLSRTEQLQQCAVRHEVDAPDGRVCPAVLLSIDDFGAVQPVRETHSFVFDCVFDDADGQAQVYDQVLRGDLVAALDEGTNVAVVAYGQTGSGKTHTILGPGVKQHRPTVGSSAVSSPPSGLSSRGPGGRPSTTGSSTPPRLRREASQKAQAADTQAGADELHPDAGLFHRMLEDLLQLRSAQIAAGAECAIALTAVEVYNDDVFDLLVAPSSSPGVAAPTTGSPRRASASSGGAGARPAGSAPKLAYREVGEEMLLADPVVLELQSHADAAAAYALAASNRATGATKMNDASSRSHALFFVDVFRRPRAAGGAADCTTEEMPFTASRLYAAFAAQQSARASGRARSAAARPGSGLSGVARSRICLADLAGNERVKRSAVSGDQLAEANHVNRSLSALGTVIHGIACGDPHIRFRDSKLTRLLRPTLASGTSRTKVLFTVSPVAADATESLATLRFAQRVKDLPLPKVKGHSVSVSEESAALESTLADLHGDVAVLRGVYGPAAASLQRLAWSEQERRLGVAPRASRRAGADAATRTLKDRVAAERAHTSAARSALQLRFQKAVDDAACSGDADRCRAADDQLHISDAAVGELARHIENVAAAGALELAVKRARDDVDFCADEAAAEADAQQARQSDREAPLRSLEEAKSNVKARARELRQQCDAEHTSLMRLCMLPQSDPVAVDAARQVALDRACVRSWAEDSDADATLVAAVQGWSGAVDELLACHVVETRAALGCPSDAEAVVNSQAASADRDVAEFVAADNPRWDCRNQLSGLSPASFDPHDVTTLSSDDEAADSEVDRGDVGRRMLREIDANSSSHLQRDAFKLAKALSAASTTASDEHGALDLVTAETAATAVNVHPQLRPFPAATAAELRRAVNHHRDAHAAARLIAAATDGLPAPCEWRWNAPACEAAGVLCEPLAVAIGRHRLANADDEAPQAAADLGQWHLFAAASKLASIAANQNSDG